MREGMMNLKKKKKQQPNYEGLYSLFLHQFSGDIPSDETQ